MAERFRVAYAVAGRCRLAYAVAERCRVACSHELSIINGAFPPRRGTSFAAHGNAVGQSSPKNKHALKGHPNLPGQFQWGRNHWAERRLIAYAEVKALP